MTDPRLLADYERRFRDDPDPWAFETSAYEREKRASTIAACGGAVRGSVLELGAANGVLAAELAPLARELVAVEAVPTAAALAATRLARLPHAQVVTGLIPGDVPPGPYDLVVASEILYYLDAAAYAATLARLPGWLAPDARLVAVHWRPASAERPRSAAQVHQDLVRHAALRALVEAPTDDYLLTVLAPVLRSSDSAHVWTTVARSDPRPSRTLRPAPALSRGRRQRERVHDTTQRAAWIAMPAKDEASTIGVAIDALSVAAAQVQGPVHLVVVDDGSTDETAEIAAARLDGWLWGASTLLPGPAAGVGWARRVGLDHALTAANARGAGDALIATTDADSRVPPHWLQALHARLDEGHVVLAGDIVLDRGAPAELVAARDARLAWRLAQVRQRDPDAQHPHFAGANLAWAASALTQLTPLPTPPALEDDALRRACERVGLPVLRDATFPVTTSARTEGRAELGLAAALQADAERLGLELAGA